MSIKSPNIIDIDIEKQKQFENVPYNVSRKVLKQDELELIAGYDRHKDGGECWKAWKKFAVNPNRPFPI